MWSTENVLDVTKSAIAQLINGGYMDEQDGELDGLDSQYIVDLGKKLNITEGPLDQNSAADIFFKALINQCGKIVVDTRSYVAQLPKLYVDPINWGLFSEHIMIELSDVMIDEMWNPAGFVNWFDSSTGTTTAGEAEGSRIAAIEFGCYKPVVSAQIYNKAHGLMVALTIAREQMFTAFRGIEEFNSFIAGLYNSVENTIQLKAEIYALMTVSMGIAKSISHDNEIKLLTEYNASHSPALSVTEAIQNADFLKFALQRIAEVKDNVKRMSYNYNNGEHITFSSENNLILLNKFSNAAKFNVLADTYHNELIGIGDYDKITSWQACVTGAESGKDPYNYTAISSIMLSDGALSAVNAGKSRDEDVSNTDLTNIIGVLYDRLAMGITIDRKKTTSQYSASRDTTNFFYHSLVNYVVNDNYPIVTFTLN